MGQKLTYFNQRVIIKPTCMSNVNGSPIALLSLQLEYEGRNKEKIASNNKRTNINPTLCQHIQLAKGK